MVDGVAPRIDPYAAFASVYDQGFHRVIPRTFYGDLGAAFGVMAGRGPILDIGCGTGLLTVRLARLGVPVLGVDRSPDMLTRARARCRRFGARVRFACGDVELLNPAHSFRLATACGDLVNHYRSRRSLLGMLRRTRALLDGGGAFAFDSLDRSSFEKYWDGHSYLMESPHGDLVMRCSWDASVGLGRVRMVAYEARGGGLHRKSVVSMVERHFSDAELRAALFQAGFDDVWLKRWNPWADHSYPPDRGLWVASQGGTKSEVASCLRNAGFSRQSTR